MKKVTCAIVGILIIAVGIVLGLNALGITNIDIFFDGWWTLLIIIPCIIGVIKTRDKAANIFGILVGVALLLAEQGVVTYRMLSDLIIPIIIILIGVKLVSVALKKATEQDNK